MKRWSIKNQDEMINRFLNGDSFTVIAKDFNASRNQIAGIIWRSGATRLLTRTKRYFSKHGKIKEMNYGTTIN
jgi:hypothetical protein